MPGAVGVEVFRRLENAELEQLPCVIPLVERVADLEPFVALKAYQIGVEHGRGCRSERRLADAGFAFEKQWPLKPQRQEK